MKKEIGMIFKLCRTQCCLKQSYIAFRLGVSINSYANIESGRVNINTNKLQLLSQLFGLKGHQVLALAEEVSESGEIDQAILAIKKLIQRN